VALLTRRQKDGAPVEPLILGNILAALLCLPFALRAAPTPLDWLGILYLGVFQLGLAYLLYAAAVRHLKAVEMVLIPVVEPILNPLWVFLVVGERPGIWAVLGGLVVLAAITARGVLAAARPTREAAV
jgi:drug/metabolite transporter (DMT)-like permease